MRLAHVTRTGWILTLTAFVLLVMQAAQATPPEIVTQPESAVACDGGSINFAVVAIGDPAPEYQWQKDGIPILGEVEATYEILAVGFEAEGEYTVVVSNIDGDVTSAPATLTVVDNNPPAITVEPVSLTICTGDQAVFSVVAEGSEPLTYQWRRNGMPIFAENGDTYTIDSVGEGADVEYDVIVSNPCGTATSVSVTLELGELVIHTQPQDNTICETRNTTLSVNASGLEPLEFQWRLNGVDIPGAQSAMLEIDPVEPDDAGEYTVYINNPCGDIVSNPALLTVDVAPTITSQPVGGTVCAGGFIEFEVVAIGTEPLDYKWYLDGNLIGGATESTYQIPFVQSDDVGDYTVEVSNYCDHVVSDPATLVVDVAPGITQQPTGAITCVGEAQVQFTIIANGSEPLEYQWYHDDVLLVGENDPTLTVTDITFEDAGGYYVEILNGCGTNVSATVTLEVVGGNPVVMTQPLGDAICAGEDLTLSVEAIPPAGLSYQWRQDGVDIDGATDSSYSISFAALADAGVYDVVVSNPCGPTPSNLAEVVVVDEWPNITTQPVGDVICESQSVTFSVVGAGPEPLSYQWYQGGAEIVGATDPQYTINDATVADAGDYRVLVSNPCGYDMSDVATLGVITTAPSVTAGPGDTTVCEGSPSVSFIVELDGDPPFDYQWFMGADPIDGATNATLTLQGITVEDAGEYHVEVFNACGMDTSPTAMLTVNTQVTITEQPAADELCEFSPVTFSVQTSGTEPFNYQWYKGDAAIVGATNSTYTIDSITPDDAADYHVTIQNPCGIVSSDSATLTVYVGPTITEQPIVGELCLGEDLMLTVSATGTPDLRYQWYKDNAILAGETDREYSVDVLAVADSGQYQVVVSNDCDQVISNTVIVAVDEPARIDVQPASNIIVREDTNTFCVVPGGTAPFEYQWRRAGVDIDGATDACYDTGAEGMYSCLVTNRCGQVISAAAQLTIAPRLTIAAHSSVHAVKLGQSVTLTATADRGLPPYTYLWSNGATITTFAVTPTENTTYSVTATDALGQTATAEVNVLVALPMTVQTRASAYILQPGESSTLTADVVTGGLVPFTYLWSTGETTATIDVSPTETAVYQVTVSDSLGQTGTASVAITINNETGEDEQSQAQQPNTGDDTQTGDDTTGDTSGDDTTGDPNDTTGDDQSQQETPVAAGVCPLLGFSMIGFLVASLCWTRGTRRQ